MGGGTSKSGDPSGKDESRKLLTPETIQANSASIRTVFERLLKFGDGPTDAVMVDNDEWLSELGYIDLLRNVGPHRSEEHTSELQSLMRISYAVFCLKKKKRNRTHTHVINNNNNDKTIRHKQHDH